MGNYVKKSALEGIGQKLGKDSAIAAYIMGHAIKETDQWSAEHKRLMSLTTRTSWKGKTRRTMSAETKASRVCISGMDSGTYELRIVRG